MECVLAGLSGDHCLVILKSLVVSGKAHIPLLTFTVHQNRLKPSYTPPSLSSTETKWSGDTLPTYTPISGVGGYTALDSTNYHSRPARNRRPPARYNDYLHH